jgi:hypothetical protein
MEKSVAIAVPSVKRTKGIDVASYKLTEKLLKEDTQKWKQKLTQTPNAERDQPKREWASFLSTATKLSKKKKRKINAAKNQKKREEKAERERKQKVCNWKPTELDFELQAQMDELHRQQDEWGAIATNRARLGLELL